jgi:Tol biopolymer transport system component
VRRLIALFTVVAIMLLAPIVVTGPAQAKVPGSNGQIVFARFDHALGGTVIYTVNPDGSHLQELFARGAELPHWSPDGSQVAIFCCDDGMAAHIVNPDTGGFRELAPPDPTLEIHCGFAWSPDGQRLACESFGVTDPSRNGIYTIRSSDGGGLTRITSSPGGDDIPGDYSPDGKRLVFLRTDQNGQVGLFVVKVNGTGLQQIAPPGMILDPPGPDAFGGSWSPSRNNILFVARTAPDQRRAIWVVNADGSWLHQLAITPSCGGAFSDPTSISCFYPGWSPDGRKIVFTRVSADGRQSNIYTVNADGSGLFRVTNTGGDSQPDWGPHPLAT